MPRTQHKVGQASSPQHEASRPQHQAGQGSIAGHQLHHLLMLLLQALHRLL